MTDRRARVAATEARFRATNEQLHERYRALDALDGLLPFICECGDDGCVRVIPLEAHEYEEVRAHDGRFFVAPGHANDEGEHIVEEYDRYAVVQKELAPTAFR